MMGSTKFTSLDRKCFANIPGEYLTYSLLQSHFFQISFQKTEPSYNNGGKGNWYNNYGKQTEVKKKLNIEP